jgi:hypothetical protein
MQQFPVKISGNAQVITPILCLTISTRWGIFNTDSGLGTGFSQISSQFIVIILTHKGKNARAQDRKAYEEVEA